MSLTVQGEQYLLFEQRLEIKLASGVYQRDQFFGRGTAMTKTSKQIEQKEIGRIKLTDSQDLVASIIDGEKLDLRIWVESDSYKG